MGDFDKKKLYDDDSREIMLQRWTFSANNYTFVLIPVFLKEIPEFIEDSLPFIEGTGENGEVTEFDYKKFMLFNFMTTVESVNPILQENEADKSNKPEVSGRFKKIINRQKTLTNEYSKILNGGMIAKWMERKVKYDDKPIRFDDLEEKFFLNKTEIAKMYQKLVEISDFPYPLM